MRQHREEDITKSSPPQLGNSQAYLLRRLARDAPEVMQDQGSDRILKSGWLFALVAAINYKFRS
jgi:hypothetical protein